MAGVHGKFTLPGRSKDLEFTIVQFESPATMEGICGEGTNVFSTLKRQLRVHLRPRSRSAVKALRMLDAEFSKEYESPGRSLLCASCKIREIAVDEKIQLTKDRCNGIPSHAVDDYMEDLFSLIGRQSMHPFYLTISPRSRLQN